MYLDFAPLEGITGAAFRQLHHKYFPGVDRYYMPFISPTQDRRFTPRDLREITPENNRDLCVVPQLLTKNVDDFLWAAGELHAMGYEEINLNTGCPSGTVTAKGKGSGMLANLDHLRQFLDEIYTAAPCRISIKTRLGIENPEEFDAILALLSHYPVSELIIHPRVRKDFYKYPVRKEAFHKAYLSYKKPLSYNGSIVTASDYTACTKQYPALHSVMIGQALVSDPFLAGKIKFGTGGNKEIIRAFHDELLLTYTNLFGSRNNAIRRMKELWLYLLCSFEGGSSLKKTLMKTKSASEYHAIVQTIFHTLALLEHSTGEW